MSVPITPVAESTDNALRTSDLSHRKLSGLGLGLVVSTALHLILVAILSMLVLQPRLLNLTLVTSLLPDEEESDSGLMDIPVDLAQTMPSQLTDEPTQAMDALATGDGISGLSVAAPGGALAGLPGQDGAIGDLPTGFSSVAAGRLKKNAAAKKGDYEIALFWDGPTDLDLHVIFQATNGKTRAINYIYRGSPSTGFLDLDQNCEEPFRNDPIEHVRWNTKSPPSGVYQVGVHGFNVRSASVRLPDKVPFTVEIKTPDGVKSFSGAVAQDEFEEIDSVLIGITKVEQQTMESQAERLLKTAREQLESKDTREKQMAKGMLRNIEKKYPTTKAAREAHDLLHGRI